VVGNWHALSVRAVVGIQQGKGQPYGVTLTEARTITALELEVLHMQPVNNPEQASGMGGSEGAQPSQG
jgi:hypothetical protein